jgi:tetratricopeptide (TPR) repeat protein
VRDVTGTLIGYQRDPENNLVWTRRHDETLSEMADIARGTVVSAEVNDQAGTIRDLIAAFKRSPQATTTAQQDIARGWIPLVLGVIVLLMHALTRRTAALAVIAMLLCMPRFADAQLRTSPPGDGAWRRGDFEAALRGYLRDVLDGMGGDTAWLNAGTAALAVGDSATARDALTRAAGSLDPEVRFRASYNLGLLGLRLAELDSANAESHLEGARDWYRETLMLRPSDINAKWNYELALSRLPPQQSGGGGSQNQPQGGGSSSPEPQERSGGGLTRAQAEQILDSMLEQERDTRASLNRRRSRSRTAIGRRDW